MFKKKKYLKDVGGEKSKVEKKQSERTQVRAKLWCACFGKHGVDAGVD